jgi:hypothetical protein
MLFDLFRAEWQKMTGNRMLASFTLWIYPVGATAFIVVVGILINFMARSNPFLYGEWPRAFLSPWGMLLTFPANVMVRLPIIAFIAVMFAGEYEWGTWKNIVPRTRRSRLVVTKFLVIGVMVVMTLAITSILWGGGRAIVSAVYGYEFGPEVTGEAVRELIGQFVLEAVLAFAITLVLAAVTALSVLLTRSIVGGLMLGFGLSILEGISGLLFPLISRLFDKPEWINLYVGSPGYSVDNIRSWVLNSKFYLFDPGFTLEPSFGLSCIILLAWIAGLTGIVLLLFERQDLMS